MKNQSGKNQPSIWKQCIDKNQWHTYSGSNASISTFVYHLSNLYKQLSDDEKNKHDLFIIKLETSSLRTGVSDNEQKSLILCYLLSVLVIKEGMNSSYQSLKHLVKLNPNHSFSNMLRNHTGYLKLDDFSKRDAWDKTNFTDPVHLRHLQDKDGDNKFKRPFKFFVHMVTQDAILRSDISLFSEGESLLKNWDAISTSIISDKHRAAYGQIGFVLEVPKQNVMLTSVDDLMFRNHIGVKSRQHLDLLNGKGYENKSDIELAGMLSKHIRGLYKEFLTPGEILKKSQYNCDRNEIIVTGREGVNIHPGMPATGKIKFKACIIINAEEEYVKSRQKVSDDKLEELANITSMAYGVPKLYINGLFNC